MNTIRSSTQSAVVVEQFKTPTHERRLDPGLIPAWGNVYMVMLLYPAIIAIPWSNVYMVMLLYPAIIAITLLMLL